MAYVMVPLWLVWAQVGLATLTLVLGALRHWAGKSKGGE